MSEFVLILVVIVLGVLLRHAFVRIAEISRTSEGLQERLERVESRFVAVVREPRAAEPVRTPEVVLPPADGGHRIPIPASAASRAEAVTRHTDEAGAPESLERQIGTQWLLYIGVIAIVVGVAYFEKLAIDNAWIGETARVIQGAVLGLVFIYAGLRFVRAGYAVYGQMIAGGGAAILYLSTYAAFNFYHLIERPAAFALMVAITAGVAWLADRLPSQGLALIAVGGGFGTPFLLPASADAQIALFGYDTILIGGTMVLSGRRNWRVLNVVSYLFTLLTVAGWADRFYTPEKYLPTEVFLSVFCAMFAYILQRRRNADGAQVTASTMVLWTAPIAYYLASWVVLHDHGTAFLVWLVAVTLVAGILSERMETAAGFVVWLAVTLPLLWWAAFHSDSEWRTAGLTTVGAVYLIALATELRHTLMGEELTELGVADIAWLHLNGLLMFAGAYLLIVPKYTAATGAVAAGFALWQVAVAAMVVTRQRDQALHFGGLGFTLLAIAIGLQFDGPAVTLGWAAEGAVVVALGTRERRDWLRAAGVVLFAVSAGRALSLLATDRAVSEAVLFNPHAASAAAIAALSYALAWQHYRDPGAPDREVAIGAALLTAQVVTLALLTSEINAYWGLREGHFARELAVSVTWGVYATVLIVIGLQREYAPIRYFAIVVFAVTILKVFALDTAELDRIYRVSSVIGLGILLLLTSYLYTRSKRT